MAESERVKAIERACGGERRDRGGRGLAQHVRGRRGEAAGESQLRDRTACAGRSSRRSATASTSPVLSIWKQWDGPDARNLSREFFDATVENCRKVLDAVKPRRTKFTIEMMGWSLPDSADAYLKLLKAVARPGFGVHVDICNIINSPERYYRNAEIINDVFRKLGRWVCSCHAKDLHGKNVHFAETIPGRGGIDYRAYLANITALPFEAPRCWNT